MRRWSLTAAALTLLILVGCDMQGPGGATGQARTGEGSARPVPALPVEVVRVEQGDIQRTYRSVTTLEAGRTADVVARSTGVLEALMVEEGDYVSAGQVLAQLDVEQLVLEVAQREATVDRLKGDLDRKETIFARQLGSSTDVETARFEYRSQLAQLELAQLKLQYATVTAPIGGIVTQRQVKQGNMIQTNSVMFTIVDPDSLEAVMHLPQKEMGHLAAGQEVRLQVDAFPGAHISGRVERVRPSVDSDTGTFRVTASVSNKDRRLQAGMFGRVEIVFGVQEGVLLVPEQALVTQDNRTHVFVIRDNVAILTFVQPGIRQNGLVEIVAGLQLNDLVVVSGQQMVEDGAIVEVIRG